MLRSLNPHTLEVIARYDPDTSKIIESKINQARKAHLGWKHTPFAKRSLFLLELARVLRLHSDEWSLLMAHEMGKPITQGKAELEKCAIACEYYASHGAEILKSREVDTESYKSLVVHEPFGVWFAIMPWNFPFWQVIRCAVPAIMAGNSVLLKHASNVMGCSLALQQAFTEAGARKGLFQSLLIPSDKVGDVIAHPFVKGISLTGSEDAGRQIAAAAGRNIKPCILELGGSNAFIVRADANIKRAAEDAVIGRFQNSGQSCIAAKRIIVEESVYDHFMDVFLEKTKALVMGDPTNEETSIGPLARIDLVEEVDRQVQQSIAKGAKVALGASYKGALYSPTILENCTSGMPVMDEEVFGPVAAVAKVNNFEDAILLSNSTKFGLGASIYTSAIDSAEVFAAGFEEGAVVINGIVKSDARMPFGGVKSSGFGRELSNEGLLEFVYTKSLTINL